MLLRHFIKSLTDWLFRRRSSALIVMRTGLVITLVLVTGWGVDLSLPVGDRQVTIGFDSSGGTPDVLGLAGVIIGFLLLMAGLLWESQRLKSEKELNERSKVVVVELRGLRNTQGNALVEAVPSSVPGRRDALLINLCQGIKDGEIVDPEAALGELISLPSSIRQRTNGFDRRDLTIVYGGLAPVPMTFLAGVLIDDESAVQIIDWDRQGGAWRKLDGIDDGERFRRTGMGSLPRNSPEVCLVVSVSYQVRAEDVRAKTNNIPIVTLELKNGSPDAHWSEEKQKALGSQFLETVIGLSNRGVNRIHLFLAAQSSVVFRFGRLYDKRNLPQIVVYQYQRGTTPPHPWGVVMPVCGVDQPAITNGDFQQH